MTPAVSCLVRGLDRVDLAAVVPTFARFGACNVSVVFMYTFEGHIYFMLFMAMMLWGLSVVSSTYIHKVSKMLQSQQLEMWDSVKGVESAAFQWLGICRLLV